LYTQFLLSTASLGDTASALAALLPCFWIYREVGKQVSAKTVISNPYHKWIETYSSPEFDLVVNKAIGLCDTYAELSNKLQRQTMLSAFMKSCQLEWMFWDSAYRLEKWPFNG
jgi:thiaminase/transcriptional activator TenA